MLSNHLTLCHPLLLLPSASGSFSMSQFFTSGGQSIGASASIFPNEYSGLFRIDWFDLFVLQASLKNLLQVPQFKDISSSMLSLLYGPALTSVHDYWKNHSFDYKDLCQKTDIFAF